MCSRGIFRTLILSKFLLFVFPVLAQTPQGLDEFTGAYRCTSIAILYIRRDDGKLYARFSGDHNEMTLLPLGANSFTDARSGAKFVFSGAGRDMILTASKDFLVYRAKRISADAAQAQENAVAARVKANVPSPGTEASARRYIVSLENGAPNYYEMEPRVADDVRGLLPWTLAELHKLGALKSLTFEHVSRGMDVYDVEFEHGRMDLSLAPLDANGKVEYRDFHVR